MSEVMMSFTRKNYGTAQLLYDAFKDYSIENLESLKMAIDAILFERSNDEDVNQFLESLDKEILREETDD